MCTTGTLPCFIFLEQYDEKVSAAQIWHWKLRAKQYGIHFISPDLTEWSCLGFKYVQWINGPRNDPSMEQMLFDL